MEKVNLPPARFFGYYLSSNIDSVKEVWEIEKSISMEKYSETREMLKSLEQKNKYRNCLLYTSRKVRINGVCEHHDNGCLGAAFNVNAFRRKLDKLRKMGVNAIRTSHNMPAKEVLELTDELGFLVDCEACDMWELPKTEFDYA